DGSTGSWQTNANALPASRSAHSSVVANGYVYVIGGSSADTVYYAELNPDGSTEAWQTNANALPGTRSSHSSVVANSKVYVISGSEDGTHTTGVQYANLNLDGSTGSWQTNANALPETRVAHTSVVANNYIYVLGGRLVNSSQSTVYYASALTGGLTTGNTDVFGKLQVQDSASFAQGVNVTGNFTGEGNVQLTSDVSTTNGTSIRLDGLNAGTNSPVKHCATSADDASIGTIAWTDPANGCADDATYASASLAAGEATHYLKATDFDFDIPANATVTGIVAEVEAISGFTGDDVNDNAVRIVKGGAIGATDRSDPTDWPSFGSTYISHGGSSDLWGETWTPADVNATDFGVAISAINNSASNRSAFIEAIRITVHYTFDASWTQGVDSAGVYHLSQSDTLGTNDILSANNDGFVGLGVSAPAARLHLAESTTATGGILFGSDTNLFRGAADRLETNDEFRIAPATSSNGWVFDIRAGADAQSRFLLSDRGHMAWGNGTDSWDTTLSRSGVNTLSLGDGDSFRIPSGLLTVANSSATVANFNRNSSDGTIVSLQQAGVEEGTISVSGTTVSYNAFTGSHYAQADTAIDQGKLVTLTGENGRLGGRGDREIIYGVKETAQANDPAVLGSYLSRLNPLDAPSNTNPSLVMAVGNGEAWVVDDGSDLAPGDSLISSGTAGHAMKDPGTYAVSHVVAKVAEPVRWDDVTATVGGKKHKKISVLYSLYDRTSVQGGDSTFGTLAAASATVDELTVEKLAIVGELVVEGDARVKGDLKVDGSIEVGIDSRGNDVPIEVGKDSLTVTFKKARANADYNVQIEPGWLTVTAVIEKTVEGFTVRFKDPAPEDATFDWLVVE
ncbi:MAG: hypothetical protein WD846_00710, partial [Patescibacteria group bacterium]